MSKENKNTFINRVNTYYDNNSALFLKLGVDKSHFNIHQPLWPSSVKNQSEAANFSNLQIAKTIEAFDEASTKNTGIQKTPKSPKIVDLGCGVGGSLLFLQQYFHTKTYQFEGLTLSKKQVQIAQQIIEESNFKIKIQQGNFQQTAKYFRQIDVVYMIEAFVHSPDYKKLIEQVSQSLAPGGLLIIVDDWLSKTQTKAKQTKWINQYKVNWLIGSLITTDQLQQNCKIHQLNLKGSYDFTPHIKTDLRNRLLRIINFPLRIWPFQSTYISSVIGGIARHHCLKQNWINYKMMVFQKE